MINVARLEDLQDRAVGLVCGHSAIHGLVKMRIERLAKGIDAHGAEACQVVQKLLIDQFKALAITLVLGFAVSRQRVLESIQYGNQTFDKTGGGTLDGFVIFLFRALAVVREVSLVPYEGLTQVLQVGREFFYFLILPRRLFAGRFFFRSLVGLTIVWYFGFDVLVFHGLSPILSVLGLILSYSVLR